MRDDGPDYKWQPGSGCYIVFLISAAIWAVILGWATWRTLR